METVLNFNQATRINFVRNIPGIKYKRLHDKEYTMVFVSEGCEQITGYSPEEFINKKISFGALIHPDDRQWLWKKCAYNLENKLPCNNEFRIICRKGRTRWVREFASGTYDDSGKLLFVEGFIQEFTAEKNNKILQNAFNSYQDARATA